MAYSSQREILANIKSGLGLSAITDHDELLINMIRGVIAVFDKECCTSFMEIKDFEIEKLVQTLKKLTLPFAPIHELTVKEKTVSGIVDSTREFIVVKDSGIIVFQSDFEQTEVLVFTGKYGYSDIPDDVGLAVSTQVSLLFDKRRSVGKRSTAMPGGSITYEERLKLLDICEDILHNYRLKAKTIEAKSGRN